MERSHVIRLFLNSFQFEPTEGQKLVMQHLASFLLSEKPNPLYLLKGYAGTGKTSMVASIVEVLPNIGMKYVLLAPTGRAAKVLNSYTGKPASTIHRKIYHQVNSPDEGFKMYLAENKHRNTLFIVDEASMIGDNSSESGSFGYHNLLDDFMRYVSEGVNCKILLIGDNAQLPPVGLELSPALNLNSLKSAYSITAAQYELTEVMRQSLESGILFNATALRTKLLQNDVSTPFFQLGSFNDIIRVQAEDFEELIISAFGGKDYTKAVIVCRSNRRANMFNQAVRQRVLGLDEEISSGDLLMIVKNNYYWLGNQDGGGFIANGDIAVLRKINRIEEMYGFRFADAEITLLDYPDEPSLQVKLLLDTLMIDEAALSEKDFGRLASAVEEDYTDIPTRRKRYEKMKSNPYFNALQVKFAYALTCHKTQGGQWPQVFVDSGISKVEQIDRNYLRWLYTAVTRATEKLFLVGFIGNFFDEE
ncbi:MAG: AAA family ATPase [Bacteroidales bacterium]|nr:AAA family ATPase [Bacteroidales bacterium]